MQERATTYMVNRSLCSAVLRRHGHSLPWILLAGVFLLNAFPGRAETWKEVSGLRRANPAWFLFGRGTDGWIVTRWVGRWTNWWIRACTDANLAWYSGRALYSTEFRMDDGYCRDDVDLMLDLGKVCYNAEVWLNGEVVGTRIWPPYRLDIAGKVRPGKNRLSVVVANLLANRMFWDIFDDAKTNLTYRRWHDSNLRRDGWCFESGLIGPVRILPSREIVVVAAVE